MKFDEMNTEELEAREAEILSELENRDAMDTDSLEARADELEAINIMRKALNGLKPDEATDRILDMFARTKNNAEFVQMVKKNKFI